MDPLRYIFKKLTCCISNDEYDDNRYTAPACPSSGVNSQHGSLSRQSINTFRSAAVSSLGRASSHHGSISSIATQNLPVVPYRSPPKPKIPPSRRRQATWHLFPQRNPLEDRPPLPMTTLSVPEMFERQRQMQMRMQMQQRSPASPAGQRYVGSREVTLAPRRLRSSPHRSAHASLGRRDGARVASSIGSDGSYIPSGMGSRREYCTIS